MLLIVSPAVPLQLESLERGLGFCGKGREETGSLKRRAHQRLHSHSGLRLTLENEVQLVQFLVYLEGVGEERPANLARVVVELDLARVGKK